MSSSALSEFMPNKFSMVHALADVVLIFGVTIWLNGKINTNIEEIRALKEKNAELEQRVQRLEQILS